MTVMWGRADGAGIGGRVAWRGLRRSLMAATSAALVAGCTAPPVEPDIHSRDSIRRIPAFVDAAETGDPADLAVMVRSLSDADPAVRFFAVRALQQASGERFGYVYHRDPADQQDAIDRWRQWYQDQFPDRPPLAGDETDPAAKPADSSSRNNPADGHRSPSS